jgi:hypothetical protein
MALKPRPRPARQEIYLMERHDTTMRAARYLLGVGAVAMAMVATTAGSASAQLCFAEAQTACGLVWNDANNNGIQDADETGIPDITVTFTSTTDPDVVVTETTGVCVDEYGNPTPDTCGVYRAFLPEDTYDVTVSPTSVTQGTVATTPNVPGYEDTDSDGAFDSATSLSTVAGVVVTTGSVADTDFGFYTVPKVQQVGTGTPGYWKNHPEAWPVETIIMGGVSYSKGDAIKMMGKVSKDKSVTLFSSLLAAKLNLLNGTTPDCIADIVDEAEIWLSQNPIGSGVTGASAKWATGEPLHKRMDAYNNGLDCAPHRN